MKTSGFVFSRIGGFPVKLRACPLYFSLLALRSVINKRFSSEVLFLSLENHFVLRCLSLVDTVSSLSGDVAIRGMQVSAADARQLRKVILTHFCIIPNGVSSALYDSRPGKPKFKRIKFLWIATPRAVGLCH
jgi:hypothetical protein